MSSNHVSWYGNCDLRLVKRTLDVGSLKGITSHQARCTAPFKLMRGTNQVDGRFEIPILHTAGGLVGGDELMIKVQAEESTTALLTTVAAQKVYGSVGISTIHPEGQWAKQTCEFEINEDADLEWLPQEVVMFGDSLFEQNMFVQLYPNSSFVSAEIVRLGRTAAGEHLGRGRWRSRLEICRHMPDRNHWEFIDQLELGGNALSSIHGMDNQPVFGSMVWIGPTSFSKDILNQLVHDSLDERIGLDGGMSCSALEHGLSARFIGSSSQAARYWFFRIWSQIRKLRKLSLPKVLRVWPMQEEPLCRNYMNKN